MIHSTGGPVSGHLPFALPERRSSTEHPLAVATSSSVQKRSAEVEYHPE